LDEDLRHSLGEELRRIQRRTGVTAILVSHSRSELERLCDGILELEEGRTSGARDSSRSEALPAWWGGAIVGPRRGG
ncbi:MAG TPA: hypothetical protein VFL04_03525, partial [Rectinemataceae bacterium]|nr:hypothetical protein [Rectinemataceae bacterium]